MKIRRSAPWWGARTGSTLALSLIVVTTMVILSGTFLRMSFAITQRQAQATDQKRSFYAAEAGLAESYAGLRIGKTGEVGSVDDPARFGTGLFWVEVEDLGDGLLALQSTGMCGSASTVLDLVVEDGSNSVAALGVFSNGDLEIPSDSVIDAYDSNAGPYTTPGGGGGGGGGGAIGGVIGGGTVGGTTIGGTGTMGIGGTYSVTKRGSVTLYEDIGNRGVARVSTNGNIEIHEVDGDTTQVLGDMRPGPNRTITSDGDPEVTGSTSELLIPVVLPPVPVPVYTEDPGYAHSGATPMVLPATQGAYQYLRLAANTQLTITGPTTLVLGELEVGPGAELVFDTSTGPIHVYVEDLLELEDGSSVTMTEEDPTHVTLAYAGTAGATLHADGGFYGAIYAPAATLDLAASLEIFGAIIANTLILNGPASIHFDAALGASAENAALPSHFTWRIVELVGSAAPSGDPFQELGVVKTALAPPGDAHADQNLTLDYYDRGGTRLTYDGWEKTFDWSTVGQVISLERDGATVGGVRGLAGIGGVGDGLGIVGLDVR